MSSSNKIRCLVRGALVTLTPEEKVRQQLLANMLGPLKFPKGLVSVEKQIGSRRYDIVAFDRKMRPLVLIECKAEKITEATLSQALGYNDRLQAPFLALASANEIKTLWKSGSVSFLPDFEQLCASVLS